MDVAGCRHAEPALEGRAQVGDDVAEQVVGDDHFELRGVEHHVHGERIDVIVRRLDPGIGGRDFLEDALPEGVPLLHGVRLVRHAHFRLAARLRVLEGVADDPVDALEGVQLFLDGDLVVGPRLEAAADADVEAFRVLAEDGEVDVLRLTILERTEPGVEQLHRAVVDVEIELEARAEQDVAGVPVVGDARVAERPDEDRVEVVAQHRVAVGRDGDAGLEEVVRAPRQFLDLEGPAVDIARTADHLDGFGGDLLADSITRDDSYTQPHCPAPSPLPVRRPSPSPCRR